MKRLGQLVLGAAAALAMHAASAAPMTDASRFTFVFENDALAPARTDQWYTQGILASHLSGPVEASGFDWLFPAMLADPAAPHTRKIEKLIGQSIFTPANTQISPPDPADRPYAGWLYVGAGLYQETNRNQLDHFELLAGVVGPAALGSEMQGAIHGLLGQSNSAGWAYQLGNEPGVVLSWDHRWRMEKPAGGGLGFDAIPEVGVSVGNVFTYAEAGMMVRFGQNLGADYGPARVRPALSGTTWFDAGQLDGPYGWYVFAGAQGRAVARDVFLDGSTFASSPRVTKNPLVGDLSAGLSVFWSDAAKLDFAVTWRSPEFVGGGASQFGGLNLTVRLP